MKAIDRTCKEFNHIAQVMREDLTDVMAVIPLLERKLEDKDCRYLLSIQKKAYSLLRIADSLDTITAIAEYKPHPINLTLTLHDLLAVTKIVLKRVDIDILDGIIKDELWVTGDEEIFCAAILRVIRNSILFTREYNALEVMLRKSGKFAVIKLRDKGLGIQADKIEKIYEPFYSESPYGDDLLPVGLGLGTTLLKMLIDKMQGTLVTESRFGEGTTVVISVPLASKPMDVQELQEPYDVMGMIFNRFSPLFLQLGDLFDFQV